MRGRHRVVEQSDVLDVRGAAQLLEVIAGHDARDSTSVAKPVGRYLGACGRDLRGLRIGVPEEYFGEGLHDEVRVLVKNAIDALEKLGARVSPIQLPHTRYAVATYYLVATAECSSNLARFDGVRYGLRVRDSDLGALYRKTRGAGFGTEVKRRIMLGTYALSSGYYDAYYLKAQKVRTLIKQDFDRAFERFDILVAPTSPTTAFRVGEKVNDPLAMYLSDVCTLPVNVAGLPGLSIPCGFDARGLPIGLQLIGQAFDEATLLRAASIAKISRN